MPQIRKEMPANLRRLETLDGNLDVTAMARIDSCDRCAAHSPDQNEAHATCHPQFGSDNVQKLA